MKRAIIAFAFIGALTPCATAGDNCGGSVVGTHVQSGNPNWDNYGSNTDWPGANANHVMYYDYKSAGTSLVDSRTSGCQTFANIMALYGAPYNAAYLAPTGLNWANNNTCATITGCDGFDDGPPFELTATDRAVVVLYTTGQTAPYTSRFLADTVLYTSSPAMYNFNNSVGGGVDFKGVSNQHNLFTMTAPTILTGTCNGTNCDVTVRITEPTWSAAGATGGLYGDDQAAGGVVQGLLAGYKVVAQQAAAAPGNGLASNYGIAITDADRYIPATRPPAGGTVSSGIISIPVSGANLLYLAYVPIFNWNSSGCTGATPCTAAQLLAMDGSVAPLATNSLAARIGSAASVPLNPTGTLLLSLSGKYTSSTSTRLTWTTGSEPNTAGFNIERSSDKRLWTKINPTLIPAQGGGAGYTYTYDDTVAVSSSTLYYKLSMIDLNNSVQATLSATISKISVK